MGQDFSLCWDIDSLNKAYHQGYMAGLMGVDHHQCPYNSDVVQAAWEAGWEDGLEQCELTKPVGKLAS
jgi:ribosome modulation factor